jgi:hypothetical protein
LKRAHTILTEIANRCEKPNPVTAPRQCDEVFFRFSEVYYTHLRLSNLQREMKTVGLYPIGVAWLIA